jgi:hypothetical protein
MVVICSGFARSQTATPQAGDSSADQSASESLKKLDRLVEQNSQLEKQNRELMDQIESLRRVLAKQAGTEAETGDKQNEPATDSKITEDSKQTQEPKTASQIFSADEEPYKWGAYTPNMGYKVANTDRGDLSISIYSYARYLNQMGLDSTYKDAFGNVKNLQQRQDFQLNKVQIKFLGWVLDPKFRYFLYAWSSNASQGLGAQVVLAGNLNYAFNKYISVGAGIRSLPGTRSVEGNFPFWLGVDTRLIADEFFRPSYTSGVWAWGKLADRLDYIAMIGNNLSTLGVSAAQLNNG